MKQLRFYFAGLTLAAIMTVSCQKDDDNAALTDAELLRVSAMSDRVTDDDFQTGNETANDNATMSARTSDLSESSLTTCATITQVSAGDSFPKIFTVDFGTGCTSNGVVRSGMLTITFSDYLLTTGSQMTITRDNYFVNGYKIEGTVTYVNQTTNPTLPQWSRTVVNGQITTPGGAVYTHTGTRVVKQTEGVGTPFVLLDNVYEVSSGTATITGPAGNSLAATISTALIVKFSCAHIVEGILHVEGTYLDGDLDYGNGNCDNTAIYTHSDGNQYTVILN